MKRAGCLKRIIFSIVLVRVCRHIRQPNINKKMFACVTMTIKCFLQIVLVVGEMLRLWIMPHC